MDDWTLNNNLQAHLSADNCLASYLRASTSVMCFLVLPDETMCVMFVFKIKKKLITQYEIVLLNNKYVLFVVRSMKLHAIYGT